MVFVESQLKLSWKVFLLERAEKKLLLKLLKLTWKHITEAKEFLQCLIKKEVAERYTAQQAFNHSWIQNFSQLSDESISMESMQDMKEVVQEMELRKAVLSYFCTAVSQENLILLKQALMSRDTERSGLLPHAEFMAGLMEGGMPILQREFDMIVKELDPKQRGVIQYKLFLNEVYVTKMYLKELQLYNTLQDADTEGRGGVTIAEMKQILAEF